MAEDYINTGTILLGRDDPRATSAPQERTIIVSGVARSGTSMVARVLAQAGLDMGEVMDDVVFEDFELFELFSQGSVQALPEAVRKRNQRNPAWGFKRPHIHVHGPEIIDFFRNPRVILTFRDPVAIAERNIISEQYDGAARSLNEAVLDLSEAMRFATALTCPTLLVSYEKAIQNPRRLVESLLSFCGLTAGPDLMEALLRTVEPSREVYRQQARRQYQGYVDGLEGDLLIGWAKQNSDLAPLELTLFVDDEPISHFVAGVFREDLARAGIGRGEHGFAVDLSSHAIRPNSILAVKVRDRSFCLVNSDRSLASWRQGLA